MSQADPSSQAASGPSPSSQAASGSRKTQAANCKRPKEKQVACAICKWAGRPYVHSQVVLRMHACVAVYSAAYIGSDGKSRKPEEAGSTAGQTLKLACVLFELKSVVRVFVCASPGPGLEEASCQARSGGCQGRQGKTCDFHDPEWPSSQEFFRLTQEASRHLGDFCRDGSQEASRHLGDFGRDDSQEEASRHLGDFGRGRRGHPPWRTCRRDSLYIYIY